jgi:trigger factor
MMAWMMTPRPRPRPLPSGASVLAAADRDWPGEQYRGDEEDTRQAVFEEARRYPGQESQVLEYFQNNQQAMQQLAGPIFEDKTVDFILEMANVTEVATDVETLYAAPEETAAPTKPKAAKKKAAKKAGAKKAAAKKAAPKKAAAKKPAAKKAAKKA